MFNTTRLWAFFPYPDYIGLFNMALFDLPDYYRTEPTLGWWGELTTYCHLSLSEISVVVFMAILWTFFRWLLTKTVFLPFGQWAGLSKTNRAKFPESAWRCIFYIASWSLAAYVLIGNHFYVFEDPPKLFKGWYPGKPVSSDIQMVYIVQGSFYLHCMFATVFLDVWRKDSLMLCIHHVVTLALIALSYGARYTTTGVMVIFCHDFNDICLEFAKCMIYTKVRNGKFHMLNERLANVAFGLFASGWILGRMYWFPLKALYSILPRTAKIYYTGHLPFGIEFNIMLWALMGMDLYWFAFIAYFFIKIVTGQVSEMEDIREDNEESSEDEMVKTNGKHEDIKDGSIANGVHPASHLKSDGPVMNGDGLKKRNVGDGAAHE